MARQGRRTEPLETLHGVVESYAEIEELLSDGEMRGRRWVLDRAQSSEHGGSKLTDHDILDLHRFMFGEVLDWAGTTRRDDRGPGGRVSVPWSEVRIQLRTLSLDLAATVGFVSMRPGTIGGQFQVQPLAASGLLGRTASAW